MVERVLLYLGLILDGFHDCAPFISIEGLHEDQEAFPVRGVAAFQEFRSEERAPHAHRYNIVRDLSSQLLCL